MVIRTLCAGFVLTTIKARL